MRSTGPSTSARRSGFLAGRMGRRRQLRLRRLRRLWQRRKRLHQGAREHRCAYPPLERSPRMPAATALVDASGHGGTGGAGNSDNAAGAGGDGQGGVDCGECSGGAYVLAQVDGAQLTLGNVDVRAEGYGGDRRDRRRGPDRRRRWRRLWRLDPGRTVRRPVRSDRGDDRQRELRRPDALIERRSAGQAARACSSRATADGASAATRCS